MSEKFWEKRSGKLFVDDLKVRNSLEAGDMDVVGNLTTDLINGDVPVVMEARPADPPWTGGWWGHEVWYEDVPAKSLQYIEADHAFAMGGPFPEILPYRLTYQFPSPIMLNPPRRVTVTPGAGNLNAAAQCTLVGIDGQGRWNFNNFNLFPGLAEDVEPTTPGVGLSWGAFSQVWAITLRGYYASHVYDIGISDDFGFEMPSPFRFASIRSGSSGFLERSHGGPKWNAYYYTMHNNKYADSGYTIAFGDGYWANIDQQWDTYRFAASYIPNGTRSYLVNYSRSMLHKLRPNGGFGP